MENKTKELFFDVIKNSPVTPTKPDCYKCKWRGEVPGDCHSCCKHPKCIEVMGHQFKLLAGMIKGTGVIKGLRVKANRHGIDNGWFWFPWNFDPIWLEECDGFEEVKNGKD